VAAAKAHRIAYILDHHEDDCVSEDIDLAFHVKRVFTVFAGQTA
jgi:hypothetical protein